MISLLRGKTFGLVAPAGPLREETAYQRALSRGADLGWRFKEFGKIEGRYGFLAGEDHERAEALQASFIDEEVDFIWCVRGGYGSVRLRDKLDFAPLMSKPKPLIGFSDITALHYQVLTECVGFSPPLFHGPMLLSLLGVQEVDRLSVTSFEQVLARSARELTLSGEVWHTGSASGQLLGGNLTVLMSLLGTKYWPCFKGAILFLEDIGEAPYRIDRMLQQARGAGCFTGVVAVILGDFASEDLTPQGFPGSLDAVLREHFLCEEIPVLRCPDIGHGIRNLTLPFGANVQLALTQTEATLSW